MKTPAIFATIFLAAAALCAQTPSGSLRGVIEDSHGDRIPSAAISVRLHASSIVRNASSDAQGNFRMDGLAPGLYIVNVAAYGFANATADVSVQTSSIRDIVVTMNPPVIVQTIGVRAQSSSITTQIVDVSSQVHQTVVTSQDIEGLPLPARSFANITYLAPGTEPVEPSDPAKARITAVSTGGSSGLNNELSVDGGDNSDDYIGGFLQNFSPDSPRSTPDRRTPCVSVRDIKRRHIQPAQEPGQGAAAGKLRPLPRHRRRRQEPARKRPRRCAMSTPSLRRANCRPNSREGMVSRHREMPQIDFSDEDVDAILAYLYALAIKK